MTPPAISTRLDCGLLLLRLVAGGLLASLHGWGKLQAYNDKVHTFSTTLGMPPELAYTLIMGAEFFCAIAVVLGLFTRLTALPIVFGMLVAAFVAHGVDPWNRKELPLLYAACYGTLALVGAGRYSIDGFLASRKVAAAPAALDI